MAATAPEHVRALPARMWGELLHGTVRFRAARDDAVILLACRLRPLPGALVTGLPLTLLAAAWLVASASRRAALLGSFK